VNRFDVSVHAIRRRAGRRRPFEVRWQAAGRSRSKSFTTRRLADSYRAELVRAARTGLEFDPLTGEPTEWNTPEPPTVTWYQQATAYAIGRQGDAYDIFIRGIRADSKAELYVKSSERKCSARRRPDVVRVMRCYFLS